jgi:hypothetical protein
MKVGMSSTLTQLHGCDLEIVIAVSCLMSEVAVIGLLFTLLIAMNSELQ